MATGKHDETVRQSFRRQKQLFEGDGAVFARRPASASANAWLEPLDPSLTALDVACGAGHVAEQLAPAVRQVVGVDLTPELLALGAARLRDAGVTNVLLQRGVASDLPFVDTSFDLVLSRSALHHFGEPEAAVAEMARVCRPGGRVVISDVVVTDPAVREAYDGVHRALDPSHGRAFTADEIVGLLEVQVGPVARVDRAGPGAIPLDAIVTAVADRDAVVRALDDELAGGPPTGFLPARQGDTFTVSFTSVVAEAVPR